MRNPKAGLVGLGKTGVDMAIVSDGATSESLNAW
jgi:hypothetical protein